jgi:hypothetical protein
MNQPTIARHPWKALAAAGAMLVLVQGARAAAPDPEVARVNITGQLPLREACQSVDADLAGALTSTWDDARKPSAVAVTFKVQRHHVYDVAPQADSPAEFHQIRRAVHGLRCDGGDDAVHNVRFVVRFVDVGHDSRVAMISDAAIVDEPAGR